MEDSGVWACPLQSYAIHTFGRNDDDIAWFIDLNERLSQVENVKYNHSTNLDSSFDYEYEISQYAPLTRSQILNSLDCSLWWLCPPNSTQTTIGWSP